MVNDIRSKKSLLIKMYMSLSASGVSKWIATVLLLMSTCFSTAVLAANLTFNIQLVSQLDPFSGDNRYADIWGAGDYAYIGSFSGSGVGIIDVSTPSSPVLTGTYNPASGGQFKDVKVYGNIGYFASDNGGGVHIVDLSNPASPALISQVGSAIGGYNNVHNVFVENGFLYEVSNSNTVRVFDIQTPASPVFVRDIVTTDSNFIHDITVINNRLYSSGFGGTTDIYDVSSIGTNAPTLLGSIASGSNSHANWVSQDGTLLASAREFSGGDIRLYDISNPASPVLTSTITAASLGIDAISAHNPVIFGDYLFASWYQAGLQMFDISDPFNPLHVGAFDTFPGAVSGFDGNWGVYPFLGADRVLLSDLDGGLFVVDVTAVVPIPAALWLFVSGLIGFAGLARRKQA